MIDVHEFGEQYRAALLEVAAQDKGVPAVEAYRKYQTDAMFHAQVEAIVLTAIDVLRRMERGGKAEDPMDPLREVFHEEASGLLGWTEH